MLYLSQERHRLLPVPGQSGAQSSGYRIITACLFFLSSQSIQNIRYRKRRSLRDAVFLSPLCKSRISHPCSNTRRALHHAGQQCASSQTVLQARLRSRLCVLIVGHPLQIRACTRRKAHRNLFGAPSEPDNIQCSVLATGFCVTSLDNIGHRAALHARKSGKQRFRPTGQRSAPDRCICAILISASCAKTVRRPPVMARRVLDSDDRRHASHATPAIPSSPSVPPPVPSVRLWLHPCQSSDASRDMPPCPDPPQWMGSYCRLPPSPQS